MISPRLNASHASLRSANERLRRMSAVSVVTPRQQSLVGGTEETIVENGSMERLQMTCLSAGPANGRQPAMSNGSAR